MNFIAQLRAAEECGFADARRAGKKGANEEAFKLRVSVLDLSCLGIRSALMRRLWARSPKLVCRVPDRCPAVK